MTCTPAELLDKITAAAYTEVVAAFDSWLNTNASTREAREAHQRVTDAQETLQLAMVSAGHPVEGMSPGAAEGYYELNLAGR